jgi:hypothetical protein
LKSLAGHTNLWLPLLKSLPAQGEKQFQKEARCKSLDEAYKILDAFASVGALHFDVTFLDIHGAPSNRDKTGPDISRGGLLFRQTRRPARTQHRGDRRRLMELSSNAKENGERYALVTAENAVAPGELGRRQSRT